MPTHYVLSDYQSVQPTEWALLDAQRFRVKVFLGPDQTKFAAKIDVSLQKSGLLGECIKVARKGKNALDFHIAFYMGRLAEQDSTACFHVIAKDKGYDPLILHLNQQGIYAKRSEALTDIPLLKAQQGQKDHFKKVVDLLKRQGRSRPGTLKRLTNTIASLLQMRPDSAEVATVLKRMEAEHFFTIDGKKLIYTQAT